MGSGVNFDCWASGTWAANSWVVGSWCPGLEPVVVQQGGMYPVRRFQLIEEMDDDALAILLITEILLNE